MTEKLLELVGEVLGIDPSELDMTRTMDDVDAWDSLNHLKLVTAVEEEYSIRLEMDEIESITSLEALREAIARHSG